MVNVRIYYAHGIVHDFIGISAEDGQMFDLWLRKEIVGSGSFNPVLKFTYYKAVYYLDRDFVCSGTITSVESIKI